MSLIDNKANSIQDAVAKTAKPAARTPANLMRETLSLASTQQLMAEVLHDNRESFVASLIDLYSSDTFLQKCNPGAVLRESLKAVSLKLPINKALGFAWIIPYNDSKSGQTLPQMQIGYRGYIQLAMRTGAYRTMNMDNVYEGEVKVVNRLTGEIDLSGERVSDKVVGYFAYIETVNGFSKTLYWATEKVIAHAKKFSKSYNSGAAIWKQNFDEMAQKTVMRNLISKWGVMSVDLQRAIDLDNADLADRAITGEGSVDSETGEIVGSLNAAEGSVE